MIELTLQFYEATQIRPPSNHLILCYTGNTYTVGLVDAEGKVWDSVGGSLIDWSDVEYWSFAKFPV